MSGRRLRIREGVWAFIPDPLPPKLELKAPVIKLLASASEALGRLGGVGRNLPNPHLLVRPFIRVEAVYSSRIEGTQASLQDLYAAEAAPPLFPMERRADVLEVRNYVRALQYGITRLQELPISTRLLAEMHGILLEGVRGQHRAPGELRRVQNWIGGPGPIEHAVYVPPPPEEVPRLMSELERYIHGESPFPTLVDLALVHYQFEAIHPFLDGNGRIGRLLIVLMLLARGVLEQPLLYLSAYLERHRSRYYELLRRVSEEGAWEEWIAFFLEGVRVQANDASRRAKELYDLRETYRRVLRSSQAGPVVQVVADHLFVTPVFSVRQLERATGHSFAAVNRAVRELQNLGWVTELTGHRRNRLFAAPEVLALLNP